MGVQASSPQPRAKPGHPTLLIVDDQLEIRTRLWAIYVEGQGYCCEEASSGEAGLARLLSEGVGIVIVEGETPDLTGLEFLHRLSPLEIPSKTHVILHTDVVAEALVGQAMASGAQGVWKRPASDSAIHLGFANAVRRSP